MNKKIGIRTLGMFESGFRTITTRETPVHLPKDLQGLKIRVPNNPINIATFRAMGANATPMAISEVFTGLQQGTVDGQDHPIGTVSARSEEHTSELHSLMLTSSAVFCFKK